LDRRRTKGGGSSGCEEGKGEAQVVVKKERGRLKWLWMWLRWSCKIKEGLCSLKKQTLKNNPENTIVERFF
jgi:hypothetical protein